MAAAVAVAAGVDGRCPLHSEKELPARPRISEWYRILPMPSGEVRLDSATRSFAFRAPDPEGIRRVLAALDGTRTVDQIRRELAGPDLSLLEPLLQSLNEHFLLREGTCDAEVLSETERRWWQPQIDFFSNFSTAANPGLADWPEVKSTGYHYQSCLRNATVGIFGCGRLGSQVARDLSVLGIGRVLCVDDEVVSHEAATADAWYDHRHVGQPRATAVAQLVANTAPLCSAEAIQSHDFVGPLRRCDVAVLAQDAFRPSEYESFNEASLSLGLPWTSCRVTATELQLGPTVVPRQTACWTCFDVRRRSNLTEHEEAVLVERAWGDVGMPPTLAVLPGLSFLALDLAKLLTGFAPVATLGSLLSVSLLSSGTCAHPVLRLPRCRSCGRPSQPRPAEQIWDIYSTPEDSEVRAEGSAQGKEVTF